MKRIRNAIIARFFRQSLPTRGTSFLCQSRLFLRLIQQYSGSPLYTTLALKQAQLPEQLFSTSQGIKSFIAQFPLVEYKDHILPLVEKGSGITHDDADFIIKTSGTSDANTGGKLIPAETISLRRGEQRSIYRTISQYISERPLSQLLWGYSFALTAPFDRLLHTGYISGCMRHFSRLSSQMMYPSLSVLGIEHWTQKREAIITELLDKKPFLKSIHGVPTRPLEIIDELISRDPLIASQILSELEYISIGGGPALDYKQQFQERLISLGLKQTLSGSNNHNASEGFLGAQVRYFSDLDYHWMSPMMHSNFFLLIPVEYFSDYGHDRLSYTDMIMQSHLLHEVEYGREYLMMFANDRIPWLYNIKDKVIFQKNDALSDTDTLLEYTVTGRYGMASNIFNEHLELEHLTYVFDRLQNDGYMFNNHAFVAGMEIISNNGIFHLIIESDTVSTQSDFVDKIDAYLAEVNEQWKIFRSRKKISHIKLYVVPGDSIRKGLIALDKMHEQSKIPYLSDKNFKEIIEPLLQYIFSK